MSINRKYFKLFINDLFLPLIALAFLIYINYLHINCLSVNDGYLMLGKLSMLRESLLTSILCFAFFLFASYYFIDKARQDSMLECIRATSGGARSVYFRQLGVLFCVAFLFYLVYLFYNLYAYFAWNIGHFEVLWHIAVCLFVYIFLVSAAAVLLGTLVALFFKRLAACLIMITIMLLVSPVSLYLIEATFYGYGINLFSFYEFICLFPRDLQSTPLHSIGYSLLPDRVSAAVFYITLFLIPIMIKLLKKRSVVKYACVSLCGVICAASLTVYFLPGARTLTQDNAVGSFAVDRLYYMDEHLGSEKSEDGGFSVLKYDMELTVKNQLSAKVTMSVDNRSLDSYKFTLYHGFIITGAENQDGAPLEFTQDGDYVEVKNSGAQIASITLYYAGYNPTYFAHSQGISLPGNLPFFPRSGYQVVYDVDEQGFYSNFLDEPAQFHIRVNYGKTVYSNLDSVGHNTFSGVSDNCVLVSGFLDQTAVDGVEVVYPYLDAEQFEEEMLKADVLSFLKSREDDNPIEKIIILPYVNMGSYARCNYYSDGTIVCLQLRTLSTDYPVCLVANEKQALFALYNTYMKNHSDFENRLSIERQQYEAYPDLEPGLAIMMQDAIDRLGEDEALSAIDSFAHDRSDKRSYEEFFSSLQ